MPHSDLYAKLRAEADAEAVPRARPRRLPSRAPDRVSNAPVIDACLPLNALAAVIERDWQPVNYAARPYLDAMHELNDVRDSYGRDSGKSIVLYFLNNARSWRGDTARAVKAELRRRVK